MLLLEAVLVARAQLLHRGQVHLVEGREQRLGRLRLDQALRDARAQARHRHALLGAGAAGTAAERCRGAQRRSGAVGRRRRGLLVEEADDVATW